MNTLPPLLVFFISRSCPSVMLERVGIRAPEEGSQPCLRAKVT